MRPMIGASLAAGGAAGVLIGAVAIRRRRHYRRLDAALRCALVSAPRFDAGHPPARFDDALATVGDFLPPAQFDLIRREAETLAGVERNYVPTHKKGGTIAYETVIASAPAIVGLYHSHAMQGFVSRTIGVNVIPTPLHDQSSLSVLVYERPGDHIGWHFDHNFYRGRHFTVLLALENRGSDEGSLSHARLAARLAGVDTAVATPPNSLILFEGAKVLHKVSALEAGERRMILSMTYCTDARANLSQAAARRIKDTAFFGLRALWT